MIFKYLIIDKILLKQKLVYLYWFYLDSHEDYRKFCFCCTGITIVSILTCGLVATEVKVSNDRKVEKRTTDMSSVEIARVCFINYIFI